MGFISYDDIMDQLNPYRMRYDLLTAEMIPTLACAKTDKIFKKSIALTNTKKCESCKNRIRADLVFCPFCGERMISLPYWSAVDENVADRLNAIQKEIVFAPAGFMTKVFHSYRDIVSARIRAGTSYYHPSWDSPTFDIELGINSPNDGDKEYCTLYGPFVEMFELINSACKRCASHYYSVGSIKTQKSEYFDSMTGIEFENYCASLLAGLGYSSIRKTKASGDQGVDLLAEKNRIKYAIQCKRYNSPIGNSAIQEVYAGACFYNCNASIVMTNSIFTNSAKELANRCHVELWDGHVLALKKDQVFLNSKHN